jgi:hypothetical protein
LLRVMDQELRAPVAGSVIWDTLRIYQFASGTCLPSARLYPGEHIERVQKVPDTIPLICAGCGATVMRHPAMRLRRVLCLECVQRAKAETKRVRREKRLQESKGGVQLPS